LILLKFNKLFDFYIKYYFHVAILAVSLTAISSYDLYQNIASKWYYLIFFSTVIGYLLTGFHYKLKNAKIGWKLKTITIIFFLFFLFFLSYYFNTLEIIIWLLASILTFWYVFPVIPFNNRKITLRNIPQLKILIVALVWTIVTVVFPFHQLWGSNNFWIELGQRFFLILALAIPFEIRDFEKDSIHLETIPQKRGVENAKLYGVFFLIMFLMLSFLKTKNFVHQQYIEIFVFAISTYLLVKSDVRKSQYYTAFWVDSVPIIWLIMVWIANLI